MHDRLKLLEENLAELVLFKKEHKLEEIKKGRSTGWALKYGFLESLQIVIDISCHIVSKFNLGNPETYSECIELLREFNYISEELGKKLIGMVGLRNLLSHEYKTVKIEKLYELLDHLDDIRDFSKQVKDYL